MVRVFPCSLCVLILFRSSVGWRF